VIRRVSESFVPAAVNLYKVRKATDGSREFFLSVQRQKDQYQGIWIVSPEGKVLAGRHEYREFKNGAAELLETIDEGLKASGPVEPRQAKPTNPLPFRGVGVQADGGVSLALYGRQMLGGGRSTVPAGVEASHAWLWDGALRPDGPIMIDTLALPAAEWGALAPEKPGAGATWTVPETIARKFTRLLSTSSDQSGMPVPEDTRVAELRGTVEAVESGTARVRFAGRWEMMRLVEGDAKRPTYGAATAEGLALYDVERKAMRSLLLVFSGTIRSGRPDAPLNRTAAVVEWKAK
jgi:hypothetical protein